MKHRTQTFAITSVEKTKQQLLAWASGFSSCCFLDNHQYHSDFHTHECLVAVGAYKQLIAKSGEGALQQLQQFLNDYKGHWFFGHLGYELQAETEAVLSNKQDKIGFADLHFFIPETVIRLQVNELIIESLNNPPTEIWQQINTTPHSKDVNAPVELKAVIGKDEYLDTVKKLQQHILRGDCYEINFCQPFFAKDVLLNAANIFTKLGQISPMPFACFYRQQQQYLLCASPERFLQKKGDRIYAQPMKGTAPRFAETKTDFASKQQLQTNSKERSENVMITDLVRNDLSKVCKEGTVQADDLFGIQTYPQVHQMVSTISGVLREDVSFMDILLANFPMGSMTGAPKKRVLQLIEQYEPQRRGLFSGSVGYISPDENFDFNVVIRSLLYNAETRYLQYFAGSAITFYSNAEQEYEECMLKTKAVREVLGRK